MEINVLLENTDFLVVDKPAGLQVHADGRSPRPTLADWVLKNYPDLAQVGEPMVSSNGVKISRPGIVHRLDRDTSGVLVIVKNQETFDWLKERFQNHQVKKTYRAIVAGKVPKPQFGLGRIDVPIGRSRSNPRLRVAHKLAKGKQRPAVTDYQVLKTGERFSYIEAYPQTGRTHQLRAHFKYLNHPIVGDSLYAPNQPIPWGLARQALHAYKISFVDPWERPIEVVAPLPPDFALALEKEDIA